MSSNKKKDGKITLGMLKGKPVTTSVPSITVKFHANADNDDLGSDEESTASANISLTEPKAIQSTGEADTSPFKYLPRLVKRSTSVDVGAQAPNLESSSPPSDPWRFLSDIKGKITKSVEEKITEIKSRNQDEGSPLKQKIVKDSKENSSISDSEDLSESSISKTCGIVSTTEGVEMSSDDETPSLDKDKKEDKKKLLPRKVPHTLCQRFRLLRKSGNKEGTVNVNSFSKLYNINTEKVEQALPEHSEEIESGVDALDDNFENDVPVEEVKSVSNEEIIKTVSEKIDNIEVDEENIVNIKEISGKEIRNNFLNNNKVTTVFAPQGFVDLRPQFKFKKAITNIKFYFILAIILAVYLILDYYWPYLAGMVLGIFVGIYLNYLYIKFTHIPVTNSSNIVTIRQILEIPAIKEYQPVVKFEGWVNEYPDVYSPETYHISKTQSAYLRLQGNLLRISHTKHKIPKRAMWNEPDIKPSLTHHRIYNLVGAKITLLPEGLAKIRHWSKKYPICITLSKDQMNFDPIILSKLESEEEKEEKVEVKSKFSVFDKSSNDHDKKRFRFRKKETPILSQRFSKLTEEEDYDESDSRASSPSPDISETGPDDQMPEDSEPNMRNDDELNDYDVVSSFGDSSVSPDDSPTENKIYIFGRTDREKEDWFRRLIAATHVIQNLSENEKTEDGNGDGLIQEEDMKDAEYTKYMQMFINKVLWPRRYRSMQTKKPSRTDDAESFEEILEDPKCDLVLWLNALVGRVLFDCMHNPNFTMRIRERIQRKLSAIKLPYFIEELLITELSLGKTSPLVHKAGKPVLDQRGLWIDLDLTYEGLIVLTLQTKLNLMKLKNPHAHDKSSTVNKSAIYHSDVDDTAESSSDEDAGPSDLQNTPVDPSGNSSKKLIKMVDKIAESRFFQAATENRYIKKAMEGVSNTDLRLKVEVRSLIGTLVLNIPTPPSDRIWVGFRPTPDLLLSAHPIVGERNITFLYVTSWIEKKLVQEFQKIMVIPNMEDFIIPVMNSKLPE